MKFRRLALVVMITLGLMGSSAPTARKLLPVDEASKDPAFLAFRTQLMAAARRRDRAFILGVVHPRIQTSGSDETGQGVRAFRDEWELDRSGSKLYQTLLQLLTLGGTFKRAQDGGAREFHAPYVSSRWPEELDPGEYWAITGRAVRVRKQANPAAPIVARLSHDIVKVERWDRTVVERPDRRGWVRIVLPSGGEGYVTGREIRSAADYEAHFRLVQGRWRMTALHIGSML